MILEPTAAFARASLLFLPLMAACVPPPANSEKGEKREAELTPEVTCKHVRTLADKDSDDVALLDQVERECIESLSSLQTRYQTFSSCVGSATDANAVYECEKSVPRPRSLLAAVGPTAKVEAVCNHVITMLEKQLGDVTGQMPPGEIEALRVQCIDDAGKQLEVQGVEAFNKEADCILAAQTVEALQACGM
jgi:hypothetical protein